MEILEIISINWAAGICLVLGLVFVTIELFTPGFGVPGITGLVLLFAGVIVGSDSVLEGIVLTMYDARANLTTQVANELRNHLSGKVYDTVVPRSIRLSEAPSHGKPITSYDRSSRGAEAYTALAAEFLKRQGS